MHDGDEDGEEEIADLDIVDNHVDQLERGFLLAKSLFTLFRDVDWTVERVQDRTLRSAVLE